MGSASAQNRIDLRDVPLSDVLALYYKTQNDAPYVICPEAAADVRRVSVRAPASVTRKALQVLLRASGYTLSRTGGVDVVCRPNQAVGGVAGSDVPGSLYGATPGLAAQMRGNVAVLPTQGPSLNVPSGSPLDPGLATQGASPSLYGPVASPSSSPDLAAAVAAAAGPLVARVYSTRFQPASTVFSAVSSLGEEVEFGKFALPTSSTARVDNGQAVQTVNGSQGVGDVILWRGPETRWAGVLELLRRLDSPPQSAVLEVVAIAVQDARTDRDALSIVGSALGFGLSLGAEATSTTFRAGGITLGVDSLRNRRDLRVLQQWKGDVESGRNVDVRNGGQTPVVNAITESEGGRVTRGVTYQPTGISLRIEPIVLEELVRAHLVVDESSVVAAADSPTFETRRLEADVRVCYGCVTVISRLATDASDRSKSKMFGFIPVQNTRNHAVSRVVYVVAAAGRPWDAIPAVEPAKDEDKEKAPETKSQTPSAPVPGKQGRSTRPAAASSSPAADVLAFRYGH